MFAKQLKKALKELDVKQKDLAALIGVTPYCITRYVQGDTDPSPERKAAIAKALGLPEGYFREEQEEPATPKLKGEIHRITLEELSQRIGVSKESLAEIARERELPGLYACNQKSRTFYIINESIFCKV